MKPYKTKCHICGNVMNMKHKTFIHCTKCNVYLLNSNEEILRIEAKGYEIFEIGKNFFTTKNGYAILTDKRFIWMRNCISLSKWLALVIFSFTFIGGIILGIIYAGKHKTYLNLEKKKKTVIFSVPFSNILSVQDDNCKEWNSITLTIREIIGYRYEIKIHRLFLPQKEIWLDALKEVSEYMRFHV